MPAERRTRNDEQGIQTQAKMLTLKAGRRARVLAGHPWVFANEVLSPLAERHDGKAVGLQNTQGHFLGTGLYNGRSQIIWRRFSRGQDKLDRDFLRGALKAALERRGAGSSAGADVSDAFRRLVWSEADGLPGLVVDQFGPALVVQALTLGMDQRLDEVASLLHELLSPDLEEIIFRSDAPARAHEGMEPAVFSRSGEPFAPRWFTVDGIDYHLDLQGGQKTGFYLDQRAQHRRVGELAAGRRRVLDAFCNQGAFALHCARAGAAEVLAVDSSEACVAQGEANAARNGLGDKVGFRCANVFDLLGDLRGETFDLIVLDPPSFARNKGALDGALRGYKELNLRALKMLAPGGILATYSCSQHVSRPLFREMLTAAAGDAKREVELVEETGQPPDHPVLLNFPESEYLKGAILRTR